MEVEVDVSVIIPCYNSERTIRRAIASVRAQGLDGIEIVVVDDGSSDDTCRVAQEADPDIRLVDLPVNSGVSHARNAGLAVARGRYVAFLDADDEWLPGKLERQLAVLRASSSVGLVATAAEMIDEDEQRREPVFPRANVAVTGTEAWRALLAYPFVLTSAVLARADVLHRVGGFDENLPVGEDQDLWIRVALASEIAYVDAVLVLKHERAQSLSNSTPWGFNYVMLVVRHHIESNRDRLSEAEIRGIIGRRMTIEGRNAYYNGLYGPGFRMLAGAIGMAFQPLPNALFLVKHAPPARWLKRRVMALLRPMAQNG